MSTHWIMEFVITVIVSRLILRTCWRSSSLSFTSRHTPLNAPTSVAALAVILTLAYGMRSASKPQIVQSTMPASPHTHEVRALWVVRSTLTSPEKIHKMVEAAATAKFNTLIVQVRGRGDAYYKSRWEPRATELNDQPPNFDPLALTLSEAKRYGLKVHAWLNTSLVANLDNLPQDPKHIYNKHPDWLAVPRALAAELYNMSPKDPGYRQRIVAWSKANRAELEGIYASPANSKVRDHLYRIWMDVLKHYPIDGVHFDYVRLASPDFDYSRKSLETFAKGLKRQLPIEERKQLKESLRDNPLAAVKAYPDKFADFQRIQITSLVERIYRKVKKRRPQVIVSAAVFADAENAYTRRFQDWCGWLSRGIIDVVCPMAYTTDTAVFQKQIEISAAAAHSSGRQIWAGIGAYRIPVESTVEKISTARNVGADGIVLFSYDFASRVSELNPDGSYLDHVRQAVFDSPANKL